MPLNVSSGPPATGSLLRSDQAYLELLSEKTTLDWGIAFCCHGFPRLRAGHQFREVWIDRAEDASQALEEVRQFFAGQGLRCSKWSLAEARQPDPVEAVLTDAGYQREDALAMVLPSWSGIDVSSAVRVLPARPMRAAFRAVWRLAAAYLPADDRDDVVEAANERLDDQRMDAFVAMVDKQPAGVGALFEVGQIGHIVDLYVVDEFRRRGVGTALVGHFITLARRLSMRLVGAEVSSRNGRGIAFFKKAGFVEGGRIIEYHEPGTVQPDYDKW